MSLNITLPLFLLPARIGRYLPNVLVLQPSQPRGTYSSSHEPLGLYSSTDR